MKLMFNSLSLKPDKEKFLTEIRKNYTTSYTGVDFFADGRKNKLVESIAFAIIF